MKPQYIKAATFICTQIANLDKDYVLDLRFGGDGDNGEDLITLMTKVLKNEREKIIQLLTTEN